VSHVAAAAMLHLVILLVLTFSIDWSFVEPAPRKARTRTKGILLDKMTRSMKSKLSITVADGFKRPHDRFKRRNLLPKLVSLLEIMFLSSPIGNITRKRRVNPFLITS